MSRLEYCHDQGILFVQIRLRDTQRQADFDNWYNTEHGPARLRLDFIHNGYRYKSRERQPTWLAMYDLTRLSAAAEDRYTSLRKNRSRREQEVMQNALHVLSRQFFRLVSTQGHVRSPSSYITTSTFRVRAVDAELVGRFLDQITAMCLNTCSGWRRSRRFELVDDPDCAAGSQTILLVHEFENRGISEAATVKLWNETQRNQSVAGKLQLLQEQHFDFYHEFQAGDYQEPAEPVNSRRRSMPYAEFRPNHQLVPRGRIIEAM